MREPGSAAPKHQLAGTARDAGARVSGASAVIFAAALAGCVGTTGIENAYSPRSSVALRSSNLAELVGCVPEGMAAFELARRFETGHGITRNLGCALLLCDIAGRTPVRVREDGIMPATRTVTYLGPPHGRQAARRLRGAGVTSGRFTEQSCRVLVSGPSERSGG